MIKFLLSLLKFALAIIIIPLVYAVSVSFWQELKSIDPGLVNFFFFGVFGYLAFHILVLAPKAIYQKAAQFIQAIFGFLKPMGNLLSNILPIYALILLSIYFVTSLFIDVGIYSVLLLSLAGFFVTLHFILAAEGLKAQSEDLFKAGYMAWILFIWVFCIAASALVFHAAKTGFNFSDFSKNAYNMSVDLYQKVWQRLMTKIG
jgi:hypothetical protein